MHLPKRAPLKDSSGEVKRLLGVSFDVVRRRKAKRSVKKRPEKINLSKSQFLSAAGREVRTPLNNIVGMAQMLLKTKLSYKQREGLKIIADSAERVIPALDRIRYYLDLESGKITPVQEQFNLKTLIKDLVSKFSVFSVRKKVSIKLSYDGNIPETVVGDSSLVLEVLNNLLANAIKYSENGKILINVNSENRKNGEMPLRISVKDCGPGISHDKVKDLFSMFMPPGKKDDKHYVDAGLNLSISKKIIDILDGEIGVEKNEQCGSIFYIIIPFANVSQPKRFEGRGCFTYTHSLDAGHSFLDSEIKVNRTPLKILLVEDNHLNQHVMKMMLEENFPCSVDGAATAKDGLTKLQNDYDLIFVDIGLPDMNGLEFMKIIKAEKGEGAPPAIAVTAYASESESEQFVESGMIDVLPKPVTLEMFQAVLENIWLNRQYNMLESS